MSVPSILHMGVGNFHRAHQSFIYQKLRMLDPHRYANWTVTGVCFLPSDKKLVDEMRRQDCTYHLRMSDPSGNDEICCVDSIQSVLHIEEEDDFLEVLEKIAHPDTRVISFTITEGGYYIDFDTYLFDFQNPLIAADIQHKERPRTVFGVLAKGLAIRKKNNAGPLILLSCDNILKNGQALKFALTSFTEQYDSDLLEWIEANISFPNSMVDRITPAATYADREVFREKYGKDDPCLVVSEAYFQWVIEADKDSFLYPLSQVGVSFVSDVHPYEEMKLSILNGGHTLVGLLGDALGYQFINDAVTEVHISKIYDQYIYNEVIPILQPIEGVNYFSYYAIVKERFANHLIRDTTARIISGSSDKVPKFILQVIRQQLQRETPQLTIAVFIIALWWLYLNKQMLKNNMADVADNLQQVWIEIFKDSTLSVENFISYRPVFGALVAEEAVAGKYRSFIARWQQEDFKNILAPLNGVYDGK